VRVSYAGVGPLEMETLITRPLEQQLSAVSGLQDMNSNSSEGNTNIQMNFTWGTAAPAAGVTADNFSVRWTGRVQAPVTGTYRFTTVSDDGVRLYVNGVRVINNWTDHSSTTNTSSGISLTAGVKYTITLEFYEHTGSATARLQWTYPGQSLQVVPQSRLFQ